MDGSSPSRRKEKRSKHNQDHAAAPKPTGRTKAACPHTGAGGSHATRYHDGQGSSAIASSHQARAYVGDGPLLMMKKKLLSVLVTPLLFRQFKPCVTTLASSVSIDGH